MPARPKLLISDHDLLRSLETQTQEQVAQAHGVTSAAIRWRLAQIRKNLPAPAARRAEELVAQTVSALSTVQENLRILGALKRAALRLLEHPEMAGELDIGPHDYDLTVTTADGLGPPRPQRLHELLGAHLEGGALVHTSHADPRTYLLSVMRQEAQQLELGVRLIERVTDAKDAQEFQSEVIHAIAQEAPETAERLRAALAARRALRLALGPPGNG